jgi:hypothetical protein
MCSGVRGGGGLRRVSVMHNCTPTASLIKSMRNGVGPHLGHGRLQNAHSM